MVSIPHGKGVKYDVRSVFETINDQFLHDFIPQVLKQKNDHRMNFTQERKAFLKSILQKFEQAKNSKKSI
jgi:hypothetical protein